MSNKPSVGPQVEKISQNRLKMSKIDKFFNEIQLSLNHIQSKIFEFRMNPIEALKKSVFGSVINVYLISFFNEHPVGWETSFNQRSTTSIIIPQCTMGKQVSLG